jgi:hypothetical protein
VASSDSCLWTPLGALSGKKFRAFSSHWNNEKSDLGQSLIGSNGELIASSIQIYTCREGVETLFVALRSQSRFCAHVDKSTRIKFKTKSLFGRMRYSSKFEVLVVLRPLRERLVSPTSEGGRSNQTHDLDFSWSDTTSLLKHPRPCNLRIPANHHGAVIRKFHPVCSLVLR